MAPGSSPTRRPSEVLESPACLRTRHFRNKSARFEDSSGRWPCHEVHENGCLARPPRGSAAAVVGADRRRCQMAELPAQKEGILLTHFIVTDDVQRSRRFYTEVLGGETTAGSSSTSAAGPRRTADRHARDAPRPGSDEQLPQHPRRPTSRRSTRTGARAWPSSSHHPRTAEPRSAATSAIRMDTSSKSARQPRRFSTKRASDGPLRGPCRVERA
jgi:hypothetical protein